MMSETVTPDTFNPPCHELSTAVQNDLDLLLQEYESQFAKDETSIRTTHTHPQQKSFVPATPAGQPQLQWYLKAMEENVW